MKKYVVATILLIAVLAGSFKLVIYMGEKSLNQKKPATTATTNTNGKITGIVTSKEMPATLGQWGEIYVYSPLDKKTHKAYLRVTTINTDKTATKTILDNYNRINGATNQVPKLTNKQIKYATMKYQVHFPTNFPAKGKKDMAQKIIFSVTSNSGDGIAYKKTLYKNLITFDVTEFTPENIDKTTEKVNKQSKAKSDMVGNQQGNSKNSTTFTTMSVTPGKTFSGTAIFSLPAAGHDPFMFKTLYFNNAKQNEAFFKVD
mgnify:FL=1